MHWILAAGSAPTSSDTGPNPLLPAWPEIVVGLIFFAILLWFLSKKVYPRFEQVYAERADAIEGGIKRAEQAQAEAQQMLQQYQGELAEARHQASRLREVAQEEQARIREEAQARAREDAERIMAQARAQIEADRQQAMAELRSEIGRLSVELASRIVGESLEDEARQRRTVDRFLAELEGAAGEPEQVS